jgi:hypothetical protein
VGTSRPLKHNSAIKLGPVCLHVILGSQDAGPAAVRPSTHLPCVCMHGRVLLSWQCSQLLPPKPPPPPPPHTPAIPVLSLISRAAAPFVHAHTVAARAVGVPSQAPSH